MVVKADADSDVLGWLMLCESELDGEVILSSILEASRLSALRVYVKLGAFLSTPIDSLEDLNSSTVYAESWRTPFMTSTKRSATCKMGL